MSFKEYPKWVDGVLVANEDEEKIVAGKVTKTKQAKQHMQKEEPYTPIEYPKVIDGVIVNNAEEEPAAKPIKRRTRKRK